MSNVVPSYSRDLLTCFRRLYMVTLCRRRPPADTRDLFLIKHCFTRALSGHHASVTAAALAASPSKSRVQDRGARTSVARWSCSCVPC